MDLFEHLALLQMTGQISKNTREHIEKVLAEFQDKREISLENEGAVMLITHLALACTRFEKQAVVAPLDAALMEKVQGSTFCKKSEIILEHIEALLSIHFPEEEQDYLLLHLCCALERMEEEK